MNGTPEFNWVKGLVHGGLAALATTLVGLGSLAFLGDVDAGKFGEGVGRMAVWTFVFALGASWGKQTGKNWAFALGALLAGIFVVLPGALAVLTKSAIPAVMTPAEMKDFERVGGSFCQPALGWGFDFPGPGFAVNTEAQQSLIDNLKQGKVVGHAWAWLDENEGGLLDGADAQVQRHPLGIRGFRQRHAQKPRRRRRGRPSAPNGSRPRWRLTATRSNSKAATGSLSTPSAKHAAGPPGEGGGLHHFGGRRARHPGPDPQIGPLRRLQLTPKPGPSIWKAKAQ